MRIFVIMMEFHSFKLCMKICLRSIYIYVNSLKIEINRNEINYSMPR